MQTNLELLAAILFHPMPKIKSGNLHKAWHTLSGHVYIYIYIYGGKECISYIFNTAALAH